MNDATVKPEAEDAWLRQWTIPEEDRAKYTFEPWRGEARWFRSPNVVCLEKYRPQPASPMTPIAVLARDSSAGSEAKD
jgi:hypothetical protein